MQTWLLKLGKFLLRKPRFRLWAELEDKKFNVIRAVEQGHESLSSLVYQYVSAALIFHPTDYSKVYWKDTVDAFLTIHSVTVPDKSIPIVSKQEEKKDQKDPWDYSGRLWFFYSNTLAGAYGWSVSQIAKLPVNDALAYIQEVLTDKQLDREFYWSASEVSYSYDKHTKKSKHISMHRPYWMLPDIHEKKKKVPAIPKALLPVGNIIRLGDIQKNETKETQPTRDNKNLLAS